MTRTIVALFGISGVGKTTLARAVRELVPNMLHLQASELMRAALGQSSEALRTAPSDTIDRNQLVLIEAFRIEQNRHPDAPILFDGHSLIDTPGGLVDISAEVILALTPSHIVFLRDEPAQILARREEDRNRTRPPRTTLQIAESQSRALNNAQAYAETGKLPFLLLQPGENLRLAQVLQGA